MLISYIYEILSKMQEMNYNLVRVLPNGFLLLTKRQKTLFMTFYPRTTEIIRLYVSILYLDFFL